MAMSSIAIIQFHSSFSFVFFFLLQPVCVSAALLRSRIVYSFFFSKERGPQVKFAHLVPLGSEIVLEFPLWQKQDV